MWDVAYLAYRLVPLTSPSNADTPGFDESARRRRLDLVCRIYGHDIADDQVIATAVLRLHDLAAFSDGRAGDNPELAVHAQMYRDDATWLHAHLGAGERAN